MDAERTSGADDIISISVLNRAIGSTWETIGPTGAGGDNTWTTLSELPLDANYAIIGVFMDAERTSGADDIISISVLNRAIGSTETNADRITIIKEISSPGGTTIDANIDTYKEIIVPVNASNVFQVNWSINNETSFLNGIVFYLKGYMV